MDINLTPKFRDKMKSYPKKLGRYNVSDLFFLLWKHKTDQEIIDWFANKEVKKTSELLDMWNGTGIHNQLEKLLGEENSEKKVEFVYKDIVVVAKADFMPPDMIDEVWEFKTSTKKMEKAKPWHEYQVRMYCTIFNKPHGVIYQPLQDKNGLYLKDLGKFSRDDKWFEGQMEKLYQFHLRAKELIKS